MQNKKVSGIVYDYTTYFLKRKKLYLLDIVLSLNIHYNYIARSTLPERKQRVQTLILFVSPETFALTF